MVTRASKAALITLWLSDVNIWGGGELRDKANWTNVLEREPAHTHIHIYRAN